MLASASIHSDLPIFTMIYAIRASILRHQIYKEQVSHIGPSTASGEPDFAQDFGGPGAGVRQRRARAFKIAQTGFSLAARLHIWS